MSLFLSTPDWMILLQLIYRVHSTMDIESYPEKMMELIEQILPYSRGVFCRAELNGAAMTTTKVTGHNIPPEYLAALEEELHENPFIIGLCLNPATPVVRGPMVTQFSRDLNAEFGMEVIPRDMHLALSTALYVEQSLIGYVILWRDVSLATYIQRDVCALTYLKPHIALQLHKLTPQRISESDAMHELSRGMEKYGLTKREVEVLHYTYSGMSEDEICNLLYISSSTFKKHLNHIYGKMSVNSKVRLIKQVEADMAS